MPAATLFSATPETDAAAFGSSVHTLLASVHWWDETQADTWIAAKRAAHHADAAIAEALGCLRAPGFNEVFSVPSAATTVEVWRERAFEIILDDAWVTGVFDRVHVIRDAAGAVAQVAVYDFKSDRLASATDIAGEFRNRYTRQMDLYRRAVAVLTGATVGQARCFLIPTSAPLAVIEIGA